MVCHAFLVKRKRGDVGTDSDRQITLQYVSNSIKKKYTRRPESGIGCEGSMLGCDQEMWLIGQKEKPLWSILPFTKKVLRAPTAIFAVFFFERLHPTTGLRTFWTHLSLFFLLSTVLLRWSQFSHPKCMSHQVVCRIKLEAKQKATPKATIQLQ